MSSRCKVCGTSKMNLAFSKMAAWCTVSLEGIIADLPLFEDGRGASIRTLDTTLNQLETVYPELTGLDGEHEPPTRSNS